MKLLPKKSRRWWWVLAVIVFFLLGFLLGRLPAPKCPSCPGGGGAGVPISGNGRPVGSRNGAAPGGGGVISGDSAAASGDSMGAIDGAGKLASGDLAGPDANGRKGVLKGNPEDSTPDPPQHMGLADPELYGSVAKLAAGETLGPDVESAGTTSSTGRKSLVANDFTYDKSNLPRYPTDVRVVASSISYVVNPQTGVRTGPYGTGAGIVTNSSFEDVVAWYRKNMPPDWQNTTIGDFGQLAQQVKQQPGADDLLRLLKGEIGDAPAAARGAPPAPTVRVSLFKPQSGAADSSIMIMQRDDKPVTAFLQAQFK